VLKRKSLIVFLLAIMFAVFSGIAIAQTNNVAKATNTNTENSLPFAGDIMDFTKERPYAVSQNLTAVPKTFEALINVNTTTKLADGSWGVVMGNYCDNNAGNNDCFDIMIETNGNPRFYWSNPYSNTTNGSGENIGFNWVVDNVSLNNGEWNHIAFVRDTINDKTYFYLNGVLTATYNNAGDDIIPGSWGSGCGTIKIGMDSRYLGHLIKNFQGKVAYTSISSTIKNASQITDSMKKMLAGTITQNQNDTALNTVVYNTDHSYYRASKEFTATPNTITATIKLPENYTMVKGGVIVGNYIDGQSNQCFNLEVNANGRLCLMWNKSKNGSNYSNAELYYEFTSTDLRNGEWTNIALVRDVVANAFKLYINGELVETSIGGIGANIIGTYAPVLGCDNKISGDERNVFAGYIKDCAIFSSALTQSQVKEFYNIQDRTKVSKTDYSSMMINWVLSDIQSTLFYVPGDRTPLTDYSGNENHAGLCTAQHYYYPEGEESGDEWFTASDDEYTMIIMPDTQCTVSYDISNYQDHPESFNSVADFDMTKTFQWMVDNKDAMNLSFVLHMGDLKQSRGVNNDWTWGPAWQNDWREWQLISGYTSLNEDFRTGATLPENVGFTDEFVNGQSYGFGLLRDAGIPYSTILGNHDYDDFNMLAGTGRNADYYNYYFPSDMFDQAFPGTVVSRYKNNTPEFAKNNDTMMNVIYEMDATPKGSSTPVKYLVVSFEFGPDDDMLAWATDIVSQEKYANHRVIVNSHAFLYADGDFMSDNAYCNPTDYNWYNTPGVIGANNSQQIYDKFVSKHGNMFLTSGGHTAQESLAYRTDVGDFGNTVYSMLVDYQGMYNAGGDSLIVVAKVNEKTKKMTLRTFNPVTNKFYNIENELEYDFSGWEAEKHSVTWKNGDTTLESSEVVGGICPKYNGVIPTESGKVFAGWATSLDGASILEKDLPMVTQDVTYYAIFTTSENYTISWNVNGTTTTTTVKGGELPVFTGSTYKQGYVFVGWDKTIAVATQNTTYTAVYTDTSVWDGKYPTSGVIGDYLSGSGTSADPYLIESASDLAAISYFSWKTAYGSGVYFKQMVNLDMSNGVWVGICDSNGGVGGWVNTNDINYGFDGVYDGNNKAITFDECRDDNFVGMFWAIRNGTVKNLTLNGYILAGGYSGILAARICGSATISGIINNINFTKGSSGDANSYAGLIGFIGTGISATINISNCTNNGDITGNGTFVGSMVGAVCGATTSLTLNFTDCHNNGKITGTNYVGGLVGNVTTNTTNPTTCNINNCSNSNSVSGNSYVGGIVGACNWNVHLFITNSNNSGVTSANVSQVGGITSYIHRAGEFSTNKIENCTVTNKVLLAGQEVTNKYGSREGFGGKFVGRFDAPVTVVWSIDGNTSKTSTIFAGGSSNTATARNPVYSGTTPTKSGYVFAGWSLTENGEIIYGDLPYVVEDVNTFYAVFVSASTLSVWDGKYPTSGVIGDYLSGNGTQESPYLIESASDLAALSYFSWNKSGGYGSGVYFKQMIDIDLSKGSWIGIADSNGSVSGWVGVDVVSYGFDGIYDGNGKSITINQSSANNFGGLFWSIKNGTVKNLTLNGNITAGSYSGTLVARLCGSATISGIINNINLTKNSSSADENNFFGIIGFITKNAVASINISDTVNNGDIVTNGNHSGGIIGGIYEGATALTISFTNCANYGTITGKNYIGGLISKTTAKTTIVITNSHNYGEIKATESYAGGIIGFSLADSINTLSNCTNSAKITAITYASGIVGGCNWNVNMIITDCSNSGYITATDAYAGGIIAYIHKGGNYSKNDVEGCTNTGVVIAGGVVATATYGKGLFSGQIIGRFDGNVTVIWSINGDTSVTSAIYPGGAHNDASLRNPVYTGETPTKAEDKQYTYTFKGWALTEGGKVIVGDLPYVLENNVTFYAVFDSTIKSYTITWVVEGTQTEVIYEYGTMPEFGSTPTKDATAQYTYTFIGWDKTPVAVTGNAIYTAVFQAVAIQTSSSQSTSSQASDSSSKTTSSQTSTVVSKSGCGASLSINFIYLSVGILLVVLVVIRRKTKNVK